MANDKQPDVKPKTTGSTVPNDTGAEGRVIRPGQRTDKVASEAEEVAELGDELGGPA